MYCWLVPTFFNIRKMKSVILKLSVFSFCAIAILGCSDESRLSDTERPVAPPKEEVNSGRGNGGDQSIL